MDGGEEREPGEESSNGNCNSGTWGWVRESGSEKWNQWTHPVRCFLWNSSLMDDASPEELLFWLTKACATVRRCDTTKGRFTEMEKLWSVRSLKDCTVLSMVVIWAGVKEFPVFYVVSLKSSTKGSSRLEQVSTGSSSESLNDKTASGAWTVTGSSSWYADVVHLVERVLVLALVMTCVLDSRDVIPFWGCVAAFNWQTKQPFFQ